MASRISGKRLQRVTVVCALLLGAATPLAAEPVAAAEGTSRVVAIGDIHGDFDAFVSVLQEAGLVDTEHRWIGGAATLVQTGDFTDRGPEVRAVMDLLMTLEAQAESAGGRVEVLLGNHEVMNLMRDVRDVNPQVYASFIDGESEAFDAYQRELVERQLTLPFFTFEEFLTAAHTARYPMGSQAPAVLERVLNIGGWFTVHPSGPLWFRGYARWPEDEGTADIVRLLDRYEAARFVVGHTVPSTKRITSRLDGKVLLIDTGMLASHYRGRASALEIQGEQLTTIYAATRMASVEPGIASTIP